MKLYANLHLHSTHSDGIYTPKELAKIAYDEGYRAKVNGKKAQTFSLNGFLAVELEAGENVVEIDFLPSGLYLGVGCFALGAVLLALYSVMALESWSGQEVPRSVQSIPSRRRIASSTFISLIKAPMPLALPSHPRVYTTLLITLSLISMSI